jgi:hypothetical protein
MSKFEVYAAIVGLPRYFNSVLPALVIDLKRLGSSHVSGFFWAYKDTNIPRTGSVVHLTPSTPEDWFGVRALDFDSLAIEDPLEPPEMSDEYREHPQISLLKLAPNPAASFSWLTAISRGAEALDAAEGAQTADFWIIVRPDLRISPRAVARLLRRLAEDERWTKNSVAVAARRYSHRVLHTESGAANLPVDHYFIGSPNAIRTLKGLGETTNRIRASEDLRQPLVNEFVLGQFFHDHNLEEYPVRMPYLIWRGTLLKSVFAAAARSGFAQFKAGLESSIWNLRGLISPGFHKRGI